MINTDKSFYEIKLPEIRNKNLIIASNEKDYTIHYKIKEEIRNFAPRIRVLRNSPISIRKNVHTIACYFRREFNYDFVGYNIKSDYENVAFLWTNDFICPVVIGGCVFNLDERMNCWRLGWVWFHPYERRKKILLNSWPYFLERFESFHVDVPLSLSMKNFLIKVKYKGPLYSFENLLNENRLVVPQKQPEM